MQYVNLGKTGMKVSRLCLGMMTYGSSTWRKWVLNEEQARPFVQRALEAGINFFDTADVYSLGASETVTGNLLKALGVKRENVIVATKVCNPISEDVNDRGLSRKHILDSIDKSLQRLQMVVISTPPPTRELRGPTAPLQVQVFGPQSPHPPTAPSSQQ